MADAVRGEGAYDEVGGAAFLGQHAAIAHERHHLPLGAIKARLAVAAKRAVRRGALLGPRLADARAKAARGLGRGALGLAG